MNRRNFLKLLGLLPAVPAVAKLEFEHKMEEDDFELNEADEVTEEYFDHPKFHRASGSIIITNTKFDVEGAPNTFDWECEWCGAFNSSNNRMCSQCGGGRVS